MKIAIVHDDFIQFGGAERVVLALHELYPDAPIYTPIMSDEWKKVLKDLGATVKTSSLQDMPFSDQLSKVFAGTLAYCNAFESFDLTSYDVVISSSARFAHGVITRPETKHVCYIYSPSRVYWDPLNYFENEKKGLAYKLLQPILTYLRQWDYIAMQRADYIISISKETRSRVKHYYGIDSEIIYPFCDVKSFSDYQVKKSLFSQNYGNDYFLLISRLVSWKKIDLVVDAFNELGLPLVIAGTGPDETRLRRKSKNNIKFAGYVTEEKKRELLQSCKALVFPQVEDFGIVPLEAMASGKPVIAYGKGGVLETVIPGVTGEFFYVQTSDALKNTISNFNNTLYNSGTCVEQAKKFDKELFMSSFKSYIERICTQQ